VSIAYNRLGFSVERDRQKMHDSGKLELVPVAPSDALPHRLTYLAMTTDDTRADLVRKVLRRKAERMVEQYVRLEFTMRSAAGRMVVDETRLVKQQRVDVDLETASGREVLDAIYAANLRRAVFAPPKAPIVFSEKTGEPLRRVIPARDVAPIVKPKSKRAASGQFDDVRNWRSTVHNKLGTLTGEQRDALIDVAKIRLALIEVTNQLSAARSQVGRLKRGGREARNLRRSAEHRVSELRSREQALSDRRNALVRGAAYRRGLDGLVKACTVTAEVEAYCFEESER
jgi:hypothetical protein